MTMWESIDALGAQLDDLEDQVDELVKQLAVSQYDVARYRTGFTHALAVLAALSNWLRRSGKERSATFIDVTARALEDEVEGPDPDAQTEGQGREE